MSCMGWVSWLVEDRPSQDGVLFAHREEICASRSSFLMCSPCATWKICDTWNGYLCHMEYFRDLPHGQGEPGKRAREWVGVWDPAPWA